MQILSSHHQKEAASLSRTLSTGNHRDRRSSNCCVGSLARARPACTCSSHPGAVPCRRHGYVVPDEKPKNQQAYKEILRRALTPTVRQLSLRRWNFRPTPSRLSNMSTA
ncbi:hypothetical protein HS088_TW21G00476 [Tripterygium wilfordii]|uniref:Uncharacterized protein n=1 Tax=Tripterygium wilfordii TaxID=458696 RepID=A0A7J7C2E2_TRIWF|nr:uncharacterized protein LOC119988483 [Tripterygium wilfordii]KAF5728329.1 hypothetical protein HS088_TW21G00476 [Tripterygium wilfordii]